MLRCVNRRSGKADAVLLFDVASGEDVAFGGVGCWNPADYAAADDFRPGDVLLFPDLVVSGSGSDGNGSENRSGGNIEDAARFPALVPASVAANTGTGWNLQGRDARFGRCGLVGDWWRALELEFVFDTDTLVAGVYTDAPTAETPLEVAVSRGDAVWGNSLTSSANGVAVFGMSWPPAGVLVVATKRRRAECSEATSASSASPRGCSPRQPRHHSHAGMCSPAKS